MRDGQTPRTDRPAGGVETNELHSGGWTCARCGRTIGPEDDVRRTVSGAYEHEACGPPLRW